LTIGTGFYSPQAKFWFRRSYLRGFSLEVTASGIAIAGNVITFINPGLPSQHFTIVIEPRVFAWSSNAYSLDFIVSESYYQNDPDPTHYPMDFALSYFFPEPHAPYVNFQPFGISFPDKTFFDFDLQPSGYWQPEWDQA